MFSVGSRDVLPCFRLLPHVYSVHKIFRKIDAKLKRWSKFGLLRYRSFHHRRYAVAKKNQVKIE
jgi:hypothetical protein